MKWNAIVVLMVMVIAVVIGSAKGQSGVIGVNWGSQLSHPLPPDIVINMLKANNIGRVKLFDADARVLKALSKTNLEVMVGIPNDMLNLLATSSSAADQWVRLNVSRFITKRVNIKYVAVGNEPFLTAYNKSFDSVTLPALSNIQAALSRAKLDNQIKATVPLNADVLTNPNNPYPSSGVFRPEIQTLVLSIVSFLDKTGAPFTINLYPFISMHQDPNFPPNFAFFDGNSSPIVDGSSTYSNVFDASYDLLVAALKSAGYPNMDIIVGEVGWPTDGDLNANVDNARRFNQGLLQHVLGTQGTPLRPGSPLKVYLFSLIDEDQKSIAPGNFERHWGMFTYDGQAKYPLDMTGGGSANARLVNAKGVRYLPRTWCIFNPNKQQNEMLGDSVSFACAQADCTALSYGSSCNFLDGNGNASYAFNSYYQLNNQVPKSCDFQGLGVLTGSDPSTGNCRFIRQIVPLSFSSSSSSFPFSSSPFSFPFPFCFPFSFLPLLIILCLQLTFP